MPGFNVAQFRSEALKSDLLRNNRFEMLFQIPPGMAGLSSTNIPNGYNDTVRSIRYHCEAVNAPSLNLLTYEARKWTFGPVEKRPYVSAFNDVTCTFFEDGNSKNFRFFDQWLRMINYSTISKDETNITEAKVNSNAGNHYPYEISYRKDYITQATLYIYKIGGDDATGQRGNGRASRAIRFRDLFPIGIADAPLNWADTNSLLRLGVNFHFLEWYEVDPEIAYQENKQPESAQPEQFYKKVT